MSHCHTHPPFWSSANDGFGCLCLIACLGCSFGPSSSELVPGEDCIETMSASRSCSTSSVRGYHQWLLMLMLSANARLLPEHH